jgi:hypothetical protein
MDIDDEDNSVLYFLVISEFQLNEMHSHRRRGQMQEDQRAMPLLTTMLTKSTTMTTLKTTLTMVRVMISMVWVTAAVATKEEGEVSVISLEVF